MWGATFLAALPVPGVTHFNPRSPCGERLQSAVLVSLGMIFQSTLPVWGATDTGGREGVGRTDFNPRSPCGERLYSSRQFRRLNYISIHAPRVGSDFIKLKIKGVPKQISIHAPRVGSDDLNTFALERSTDFNPRSPCGERLRPNLLGNWDFRFQSTLPVWGATATLSAAPL